MKTIYSIRDLSQADWAHVEQAFFYKKAACAYMKNEHLGVLGVHLQKELFLQTRFNVDYINAQKVIRRLCANNLIGFSAGGVEVDRTKISLASTIMGCLNR